MSSSPRSQTASSLTSRAIALQRETRLGFTRAEWEIIAVALGLHGITNGLLPARYHIPASLFTSTVASVLAAKSGAGLAEQGLAPQAAPLGAAYGLAAGSSVACAILGGTTMRQARQLYGHDEIMRMTAGRALYEGMVRIPLGTALPEELVFRGALLGLLSRRHSAAGATVLTSVMFGLWHIAPTLKRLQTHSFSAGRHPAHQAAWVATSVGVTAGAGALLAALRYRSRSLVAPWLAHSAANSAGLAATWWAAHKAALAAQHNVSERTR